MILLIFLAAWLVARSLRDRPVRTGGQTPRQLQRQNERAAAIRRRQANES